jgi:hypothetical protein
VSAIPRCGVRSALSGRLAHSSRSGKPASTKDFITWDEVN